jgi:integrase
MSNSAAATASPLLEPHYTADQVADAALKSCASQPSVASAPDIDTIGPATVRTAHRRGKSMSRRTGQNGTVEERNGAWRGRFLIDVPGQMERQKRSVVLGFKKEMTRSEAKRKLKEIIRQEGIDLPTYVIPSTLSFAQKVEQWEELYVAKRKSSTQDLIAYHLTYLLPKWGKVPVELITAEAVNAWVGSPQLAHLSPTTVKGIVKNLQTALGKRFGRGAISYPSKGEVENDPRCYLAEEVQKIVEAAKGQYKVLFKLAAETGARAGELYALTVDDVLFEHNIIRINKSMYRQKVGSPKTKNATRWVNVKPHIMEMLRNHLNGRTDGLVFRSKRNTPLINSTVLNKHLHPLLRTLGLDRGGMHGFRHFRVSTLVMAGTSIEVIKKWIGHGSDEMIRRYTHLRPDFMQSELEKVPDYMPKLGTKIAEFDPIDPQIVVAA